MFAKVIFFICAQALILKTTSGQCVGADLGILHLEGPFLDEATGTLLADAEYVPAVPLENARVFGSVLSPIAAAALAPSTASASHRVLPISSVSTVPANGVTVSSENSYQGDVNVYGALPFLGTLSLEGSLPNTGVGSVAFNCGSGAVAILAENIGSAGIAGPLGYREGALGYIADYNVGSYDMADCEYSALIEE